MVASGTPRLSLADPTVDVLVVGGGPVGMAVALQAQAHGASVRIVERRSGGPRPSRAMLWWPRTLEALGRLGVAEQLHTHPAAHLRTHVHLGRRAVPLALADLAVPGLSRPPLMARQADVEAVLRQAVVAAGIDLRTQTALTDLLVERSGAAVATLTRPDGTEQVRCRFVVGCDGADSSVRRRAGIPWRGHTYPQEALLADLEVDELDPTVAHIGAGTHGIGFLFPAGEHGARWRLIATRVAPGPGLPPGCSGPALGQAELELALRGANLPGRVGRVEWSTRVRLQRRTAARYWDGPVVLAGDAAHVFSPAGAQGVNTGLQDATNLGWKLAAACRVADPVPLLASYETERRRVARQVGPLTGALLHGEGDDRLLFRWARTRVLPALAPAVPVILRARPLTRLAGWVLSQGWVSYPLNPVVVRRRRVGWGPLRPGHLAPDLPVVTHGRRVGLHHLTAEPGLHVLHGPAGLSTLTTGTAGVWTHQVDTWPARRIVVVRPDGYVGYRDEGGSEPLVREWLGAVATGARETR